MSKASARDRLEQALARIADPSGEGARACLTVYADAARAAADAADARAKAGISLGPLDGAIVSIKDLFDVAGEVDARRLAGAGRRGRPPRPMRRWCERLRAAGAVIVAKTNMSEFAFSGVGANPHYGTPGNPADRARVPGGSTSGGGGRGRGRHVRDRDRHRHRRLDPHSRPRCAASSAGSRASSACRPRARSRCRSRSNSIGPMATQRRRLRAAPMR